MQDNSVKPTENMDPSDSSNGIASVQSNNSFTIVMNALAASPVQEQIEVDDLYETAPNANSTLSEQINALMRKGDGVFGETNESKLLTQYYYNKQLAKLKQEAEVQSQNIPDDYQVSNAITGFKTPGQ